MPDNNSVFEIAIMARVTWNLHSLNNEGSVGNVTEPRTVVLASGEKSDGISGEMLKHIHSYNIWLLEADKSRFCPACGRLQPQRADLPSYRNTLTGTNTEVMARAIANCALCDLHGFLVQKPPIARRSTLEFGWVVGLPDQQHREIHLHARHSMEERQTREQRQAAQGEQRERGEEEVSAQMVYHRPTRSGVYALVSLFQPWRIGLNEISYEYVQGVDRQARYRLALQASKASFMHADGAMTSTRLPHVEEIEGSIAVSTSNFPVPLLSPLKKNYQDELQSLSEKQREIELSNFSSLSGIAQIIDSLADRLILSFKK